MITHWTWAVERYNSRLRNNVLEPTALLDLRVTKIPLEKIVNTASVSRYRISDAGQAQFYRAEWVGRPIAFFSTDEARLTQEDKRMALLLCQVKYGIKEEA